MKIEKDIEGYLTNKVKQMSGLSLKWVCPGNMGVPDRIILLSGGLLFFVELKRPKGGVVEKMQKRWGRLLARFGQNVFIIKNKDEVDALTDMLRLARKDNNFLCFEQGGFFAFDSECNLVRAEDII